MNASIILLIIVGVLALTFTGFLVADYFSAQSVKDRDRRRRRRERRKLRKRSKLEMGVEDSDEEAQHLET